MRFVRMTRPSPWECRLWQSLYGYGARWCPVSEGNYLFDLVKGEFRGENMISNLQMLRGLAALAVVFYHTDYRLPGDVHTEFQAVSVFFVISGFIMTYITRDDAAGFLGHRLIRIVPLYWVCTLGMAIVTHRHVDTDVFVKSLLFIPQWNYSHDPYPLLGVGWTLNIEMYFYALFALALSLSRRWAPLIAGSAVLLVLALTKFSSCEAIACAVYGHDYVVFFPTGIAAYYIWASFRERASMSPLAIASIGGVVVTAFLAWQLKILVPLTPWDGVAFPMLLVLVALFCESAKWKAGAWALVMGNISYALYLTHVFVVETMRPVIDFAHGPGAMLTVLVLSVVLAGGAYYLIERPMTAALRMWFIRPRPRATAGIGESQPQLIREAHLDLGPSKPSV
jgi:exopolysaccharide production protein ExoZ